jgi:hypothetical protein
MEMANVNIYIQTLLVENLNFTNEGLKNNEKLIRFGNDIMRDDFFKLIIDVQIIVEEKGIENPSGYFIGALKNQLKLRGFPYGK